MILSMLRLAIFFPASGPRAGEKIAFRATVAIFAAVALCAWAPKAPHVEIRSLGIIAAVGDTCMFEHVRNAPLEWIGSPQTGFLEISDWDLDDTVTKAIAGDLDARYEIQSIAIEHQGFDTWTWDTLARRIRELPVPETPVDAYLLILRDWRRDEIGRSNHQVAGLGLYRRDLRGGRELTGVFASYRVVLMDPEHGNIIASRTAVLPDGQLPWTPVSPLLWPRTQNDLTDAQRETLHHDFLKLFDATLPDTLRSIGLRVQPGVTGAAETK